MTAGVRWVRDLDLSVFATSALAWLLTDPVRNNVPYTLITLRLDGVVATEPDGLWLRAEDRSGTIAGVALRTPPRELLLGTVTSKAAESLAEFLVAADTTVPGVAGPVAPAEAFVRRYTALTGTTADLASSSRIYRLDKVTAPTGVPGRLRQATHDDLDLLTIWRHRFAVDVGDAHATAVAPTNPAARAETARRIDAGLVWLWQDTTRPVATAWLSPPTAGIPRVSMVYTPLEWRGRGYASACVAAVSQLALDRGASATMLYADLANPLTNRIYQRIGYRAVDDTTEWRFTAA